MKTSISQQATLADIVNSTPGSTRVLETFDLDYCCGGQRTLSDACEQSGTDPAAVVDLLESLDGGAAVEWATMGPAELVAHIESTHHVHLHHELSRLDALADKVTEVHGRRHLELFAVRSTYRELRADLEPHLVKEEQVLFPMIRQLAAPGETPAFHCGTLRNPISVMMTEHERAGALLADLRELTDGYTAPADGCASYEALYAGLAELEADTHLHVHKENNVLFPAVVELESRSPAGRAAAATPGGLS